MPDFSKTDKMDFFFESVVSNPNEILTKPCHEIIKVKFSHDVLKCNVMKMLILLKNDYIQRLHAMRQMKNESEQPNVMLIGQQNKFEN